MTRRLILLLFIILNSNLFSQENCNCSSDFKFVVDKIENEHPGFSINVTKENRSIYNNLKDSINSEINKINLSNDDCQKSIKNYLNFIKDKHLQIYNPIDIDEKEYEKNFVNRNLPEFRNLNDSTVYVRIPSFNYKLWKELDQFYDSISPVLKNKKKIIVDIRNNSGGGERMYKQLIKILKSNSKKSKIAVVFNKKCASACEEVALILIKNKHIKTFGENTNGQFAYGFIKGYKTPNCGFSFITTTKRYDDRLKYEYIGVAPEYVLSKDEESDWISVIEKELDE